MRAIAARQSIAPLGRLQIYYTKGVGRHAPGFEVTATECEGPVQRAIVQAADRIRQRLALVRSTSIGLVENLSDGATTAQSMPDASGQVTFGAHHRVGGAGRQF